MRRPRSCNLPPEQDEHSIPTSLGEGFGGGLYRIVRNDGTVESVDQVDATATCGGLLNPECDPVTALAVEPWKPGCLAVAVGLVHFFSNGRILEVCGDRVNELYSKGFDPDSPWYALDKNGTPWTTVAFFGLARDGDTLLAAGIDGLYRIRKDGRATVVKLPEFREIGGVRVSFDLPDVILLLTEINRRLSVSGEAPLLVPRHYD